MGIFNYDVWVMCTILIILSSCAFLVLENVGRANFHGIHDSEEFAISNSLALSLGMLIQNPYSVKTSRMSSRILHFAMSASTLVLFAYYTCDMTSRLTGPPPDNPIKSFYDVIQHGYKVILYPEGFHSSTTLKNGNSAARQIYDNSMREPGLVLDFGGNGFENAIALMLKHPNYLFFAEDSQTVTRKDVLSLDIDEASSDYYAIGLQPDSEFTDLFNHHLLKMGEAGVIQRMRDFIQFKHYYLSLQTLQITILEGQFV